MIGARPPFALGRPVRRNTHDDVPGGGGLRRRPCLVHRRRQGEGQQIFDGVTSSKKVEGSDSPT
jgi:hypothetical protein